MSVVTGIMHITTLMEDDGPLDEVQTWLADNCQGQSLSDVADHAGGTKHPQFLAMAAGINYFDEDAFAAFAMSRDWLVPECVVLIMQPEEGAAKVFRPAGIGILSE